MSSLNRTPLFDIHQELGAKIVPFAGYEMPVQYKDGIIKEHLHTREKAGLFDVSHMGQVIVEGQGAQVALEALIPIDLDALSVNKQSYALLTSADGGILWSIGTLRPGEDVSVSMTVKPLQEGAIGSVAERGPAAPHRAAPHRAAMRRESAAVSDGVRAV